MATYEVAAHPLLSPEAQRLEPAALGEHAAVAADLLGLAAVRIEPGTERHERALRAVAFQVNYQVASGVDAEVYGSATRGNRSFGFRGGVLNPMPPVSPRAKAIADALLGTQTDAAEPWTPAGGVR